MTKRKIDWTVTLFLILNPLAAFIGLGVCYWQGTLGIGSIWLLGLVLAAVGNLSITAGYHRLYSHRSYEVHPWVEWAYLLFGASVFEGSCLKWSSDHRRHHGEVDTDGDPYSIKKGFFYAHMGWLFFKDSVDLPIVKAKDLENNPRVMFQHKYYLWLAIGMGYALPMLIGWALGSAFAGLIIAGALRIVINQHTTFFVNSLCHTLGRQTYSKDVSARDSFIVAVLTHGEGYHNFHHTFQIDYRNGIKWYHWDPTKWTILSLKWAGLAKKLRTISASEILKARLQMEAQQLTVHGFSHETIEQMKHKVLDAQIRWRKMKEEYATLKRQAREAGEAKLEQIRYEIKMAQAEFQFAITQWQLSLSACRVQA